MKQKRKLWHFCKKHPENPCPEPCSKCWRWLDGKKLRPREEMVKHNG
jgi:hypothetical protein